MAKQDETKTAEAPISDTTTEKTAPAKETVTEASKTTVTKTVSKPASAPTKAQTASPKEDIPTATKAPAKKAPVKRTSPKVTAEPMETPLPKPVKTETVVMDESLEKFTSQIQEGYNEMLEFGKEQMEKMFKVDPSMTFKSMEDMFAFSKENVDALVKSSSIAAKGVQDVASLVAEITKSSFESNVELSKKLMACKTPQEIAELQSSVMKSSYDKMMSDCSRISEASTKIAEEAAKPLQARFEASVEKIKEPVA